MAPTKSDHLADESLMTDDQEERVEMLLKLQAECISRAKKSLVNFGKDPLTRKSTKVYYTTKLSTFGKIVIEFESNHRELITLIPTSEKSSYSYFKDDSAMLFEDSQIDYITAVQGEYDEKFPDERAPQANPNGTHLWSSTANGHDSALLRCTYRMESISRIVPFHRPFE